VAAREKGLGWEVENPKGSPSVVMDSDRMAQAVGNLLSNAIKFTPAGGNIKITAEFLNGQLVMHFTDTGLGIPLEEQNKIFQPFYRGAHGRRIVQGMGLGLSIAHDIVIAHGGKLELQSASGKGSDFVLFMPVKIPREA
jgi:signal transduction histidine kinase